MTKDRSMLTISEMSNICRISRQTLIYYDKNDIFKPALVTENGYRYYSIYQVPYLREICALKDNYFPLKDIIDNFENRTVSKTMQLLTEKQDILQNEIEELKKRIRSIEDRLRYLRRVEAEKARADVPYFTHLPEQKILFLRWDSVGSMERDEARATMHYAHMALRNLLEDLNLKTNDYGWGAMLCTDAINTDTPLKDAGAYVNLPADFDETENNLPNDCYMVFPGADYVCMARYSMPYETASVRFLLSWIDEKGYEPCGDILDECLLDTTYYTEEIKKDFCLLQIPVRKKGF